MTNVARTFLEQHPRSEWLIPFVFCCVLLAQLLLGVQNMSPHVDESTHLYNGYRALKCSDYEFGREHPPLAKMLVAIPLLWSNASMDCSLTEMGTDDADLTTRWLYSQNGWWHLLAEARAVASLFSIALCLGVWIAARRMFGLAVAVLSTAILAFEPNILGHGALLLNDVPLSALFFFTSFSFYLWIRQPSPPFLLLTGLMAGLALLTKNSAVLLIPTLFLLGAIEACLEPVNKAEWGRRVARNLGAVVAIFLLAAIIIWCGYGMRYTDRSAAEYIPQHQVSDSPSMDIRILNAVRAAHLLPQPYVDGLIDIRSLITNGTDAYILGRYYSEAPWFFYPLTATIKFTLPFLVILVIGAAGVIGMGRERRTEMLFLLLPMLLYLAASMRVRRTSGIWHLFPMLPFLIIAAAAGCVYLARRYRWVGRSLIFLLVLHAGSSLCAYPNYLSYANELWGGPQNLYKHLPGTDEGQAYLQVARYMEQHPNTPCWVDSNYYSNSYIRAKYKIPCLPMGVFWHEGVPERIKGIVFVSSSWLQIEGQPGGPLAPFHTALPKARLGGSAMLVYVGEFDTRVAAARALDHKAIVSLIAGDYERALPLAKRAVELSQSSSYAHTVYCNALESNGQRDAGLSECDVARRLSLEDRDPCKTTRNY